jgi:hypothetical protein
MSLWNLAMDYLARHVRACLSYRHGFQACNPRGKRPEEFYLRTRLENFLDAIDDDLEKVGGDARIFVRLLNLSLRGLELLARLDGRLPDRRRRPQSAPQTIAELFERRHGLVSDPAPERPRKSEYPGSLREVSRLRLSILAVPAVSNRERNSCAALENVLAIQPIPFL